MKTTSLLIKSARRWSFLSSRPFLPYFLSFFLTQFGNALIPLTLAVVLLKNDGAAALGVILAAQSFPRLALVLFGGVLADRLDSRRAMAAADLTRFVSQAIAGVLVVTGHAEVAALSVLLAVHGAASAVALPASTSLVPRLVDQEHLPQAYSVLRIAREVAAVLGPACAAGLIVAVGGGAAFLLDSLSFAVSGIVLLTIRPAHDVVREDAPHSSMVRDLRLGWSDFTAQSWIWVTVMCFSAYQGVVVAIYTLVGPIIAREDYGGVGVWGYVLSALAIGAVAGAVVSGHLLPDRPLFTGALVVLLFEIPFLICLALGAPLPALLACGVLSAVGGAFFDVQWSVALQAHVPARSLARVSAYDWFGSLLFAPLGLIVIGLIVKVADHQALVFGALAVHVVSTSFILLNPSVRHLKMKPERETIHA